MVAVQHRWGWKEKSGRVKQRDRYDDGTYLTEIKKAASWVLACSQKPLRGRSDSALTHRRHDLQPWAELCKEIKLSCTITGAGKWKD